MPALWAPRHATGGGGYVPPVPPGCDTDEFLLSLVASEEAVNIPEKRSERRVIQYIIQVAPFTKMKL